MTSNWTKKELKAYILLYVSQANFIETDEEKEYILSKVDKDTLKKIKIELQNDNDYHSIKKIEENLVFHNYSKQEKKELLIDIKALFLTDGSFDRVEKNLMIFLKKILK